MRLLVLHGPNLNLLGVRDGSSGGRLEDLDAALHARAEELGQALTVVQSNHEGDLLDTLGAELEELDGIIINPAGLFGSYCLKEGLEAAGLPAIEVLLRPPARESVVGEACVLQIHGGPGFEPYLQALETFGSGVFTTEKPESKKALGKKKGSSPKGAAKVTPITVLERAVRKEGSSETARSLSRAVKTAGPTKTLGRKLAPVEDLRAARQAKTLGRGGGKGLTPAADLLTRALVRQKISDRLSGRLSAAELAAWARSQYQAVQRGAPAENGHRELLEESLQRLTLSNLPATRLSDEQLVDLLTRLDEG
ncbi:type II 3-dehydroquinate dehydratase [Myxococcus xanthus]|uniref:3-dehydroquinate dehydratase n=1 Tax=Myxococcus xanthus TaxID=34 RepID=A0A7Y4MQX3_MYXXA|nr:type II 3-dehydroquinate dehydratase [Myxococcus xanthus]NOJ78885.1 3-dehydroquinate dehydratase [Myxococcus xanthus]NOJ85678.1 3-dehydroquinate dehydratase [Myxococcus xanthus]